MGSQMLAIPTPKAVFWDLDGTLLNTLNDIAAALHQTLTAWGLPTHQPHETLDGIGHGSHYLCHWGSGLEGEQLNQFTTQYRYNAVHLEHPQTCPYPDIPQILADLKSRGVKLAIYTNKPQLWSEQLAAKFFGPDFFDAIIGTSPDGWLKPDPGGLLHLCQTWDLTPTNTVMVGDSEVDWETAKNAGCPCICVTWGFGNYPNLRALNANLIDTPDELRRALGLD